MLRRSDELRGCGISDGSILQVMSKMRGRGMHKNRNGQKEWKNATSPRRPEQNSDEEPKNVKDLLMQECNKEWMIGTLKVPEENQKIIETMAEGSDAEKERTMHNYRTAGREVLGRKQSQHMAKCWNGDSSVQSAPEGKRRQAVQNAEQEQE